MSKIDGDSYVFTQTTTTSSKPDFTEVNTDQIIEDYIHVNDPNNCEVRVTETITPQTETSIDSDGIVHTTTVWQDQKQIEVINHPTPEKDFGSDNDTPSPSQPSQKGNIWEIHQKQISNILNQIAQSVLHPLNDLLYEKRSVCLGHKVYNDSEIKGKNKRRLIQKLSEVLVQKYTSDSENYKDCITSCTGLDDDNPKTRFSAVAYHVDNHKECKRFEVQFFPLHNSGEVTSSPVGQEGIVKKCLGHVKYLYSFPEISNALAALRKLSHQMLERYKSQGSYKNEPEGYLKTHSFKRQATPNPQRDLFIFFQHQDNHDDCSQHCYIPAIALQNKEPSQVKEGDQNGLLYHIKDALWSSVKKFFKSPSPDPSNIPTVAQRNQIDRFWSETKTEIIDGRGTPEAFAELKEFMIDDPILAAQAHFEKSIVECKPIVVGQKEFDNCRVFGVNGMNTSEESAQEQALAMSDALNGHNVHWIYNASQSFAQDAIESRRNINNVATEASYLLLEEITEYFNNSSPESIAYIQCHSQGTAMVKNTVLMLPEGDRARVSVLAIAPSAYINVPGLEDIQHYASRWDFVPLIDKLGMQQAGDTLEILAPAKDASIWDHAVSSPTYKKVKDDWYKEIHKSHAKN